MFLNLLTVFEFWFTLIAFRIHVLMIFQYVRCLCVVFQFIRPLKSFSATYENMLVVRMEALGVISQRIGPRTLDTTNRTVESAPFVASRVLFSSVFSLENLVAAIASKSNVLAFMFLKGLKIFHPTLLTPAQLATVHFEHVPLQEHFPVELFSTKFTIVR